MTKARAHELLEEAETHNPGPWVGHSIHVARAAQILATALGFDSDLAYSCGLLHDIGRRFGIGQIRHGLDGYNYLVDLGYPIHGRIALTHCYTIPNPGVFGGREEYSHEERHWVSKFLKDFPYDDLDRLIQLADFLGLPDRICSLEERMGDVLSRYPHREPLFIADLEEKRVIQKQFEARMGRTVDEVLALCISS